jgi:NAD(P)-dependent dehydrogenase (short-subunit alcohol dehydrogenase family)
MTEQKGPGGRLAGRVALVTGASRGIGRAVALHYAAEGADTIALGRTQGALEALDDEVRANHGKLTLAVGDLLQPGFIEQTAAAMGERFGRLDVLVLNAGQLGILSPIAQIDPRVWDTTMAVNVNANWRLIRAFDPWLRQSAAGRVVVVSSGVTRRVAAYWGAYAVSKAALEAMARIYAAETAKTSVRVILANPGATRTAMRAQAYPGEDPATLKTPDDIAGHFVDWADAGSTPPAELVNLG